MAGIKSQGAKLTYTEGGKKFIAHLTSLGAVKISNEEVDVTDHDSPNGAKEFIAGAQNYDNISFAGNVAENDDSFERTWALGQNRKALPFEAQYADGSKMAFNGYIASIGMTEQSTDGLMGFEGEIKVNGAITFTKAPTRQA